MNRLRRELVALLIPAMLGCVIMAGLYLLSLVA